MKNIKFLLIAVLFIFTLTLVSCKKAEVLKLDECQTMTLRKAGPDEVLKTLDKETKNIIIEKINNANYEYKDDEDYNGWSYEIVYDDVTILFSNYLYYIKGNVRKNYKSSNNDEICAYLETLLQ